MARHSLVVKRLVVTTMANQVMESGEATADNGAMKENALEVINVPGGNPIPKRRRGTELEALADKMEKAKARARRKGARGDR